MTDRSLPRAEQRRSTLHKIDAWLALPMLLLSLFWLLLVIVELVYGTSPVTETLTIAVWLIFIVEFIVRFTVAPEKLPFLRGNWLGVVALLAPALRMFAVFNMLSVARGFRLMRVVTTANRATTALRRGLGRRGLGYVLALTLVVCLLGAAGEYAFESRAAVKGGFHSYGDALWWAAMVMTTMGSGYWPQTVEGRVLCVLLAIYGFAIFGYITANIATYFLGDRPDPESIQIKMLAELQAEVAQLRAEQARAARPPPPHA